MTPGEDNCVAVDDRGELLGRAGSAARRLIVVVTPPWRYGTTKVVLLAWLSPHAFTAKTRTV
jgi:hypothetical protein